MGAERKGAAVTEVKKVEDHCREGRSLLTFRQILVNEWIFWVLTRRVTCRLHWSRSWLPFF